jgi:hypothetical protein
MKPSPCVYPGEEKKQYRLYYCGICKTIGTQYGHKMRLILNHDIAFFAEILSQLPTERKDNQQWDSAFYRSNCFILPGNKNKNKMQAQIPFFFSIAAAVNVLLAKLTIDDKIDDSRRNPVLWKWFKSLTANQYNRALDQLEKWKFPLERILMLAYQQKIREKEENAGEVLDYFSESTALITGIIFQHSAGIAVIKKKKQKSLMRNMFALGYHLGKLVYLLDAWEDFEKDYKKGAFNAIAAAYRITAGKLDESIKTQVSERILDERDAILERIHRLTIPGEKIQAFSRRLRVNLSQRLNACEGNAHKHQHAACAFPSIEQLHLIPVPQPILAGSPGSGRNRSMRHSRIKRFLHTSLFVISLPGMFGLRYLPFSANKPLKKKTCDCCIYDCDCCCDCTECCHCGGEAGSGCCDCDCGCCDC